MNAPPMASAQDTLPGVPSGELSLSAMLWFRAAPADDAAVRAALGQLAEAIASDAATRIGHRHDEDRPYRTWMIDAGPVPAERFDALLYRIHKAIGSTGLAGLVQGEPHLESFAWHPDGCLKPCA